MSALQPPVEPLGTRPYEMAYREQHRAAGASASAPASGAAPAPLTALSALRSGVAPAVGAGVSSLLAGALGSGQRQRQDSESEPPTF